MAYPHKPITTEYRILLKMIDYWVSCMKGIVCTLRTEKSISNHIYTNWHGKPKNKPTLKLYENLQA